LPCLSVCLSRCPSGTSRAPPDGFSWNLIFDYCIVSKEKGQISLKSDKNNGILLNERPCTLMIVSCYILRRMRIFSNKTLEKIKAHIAFYILYIILPKNRAVNETKWKCMAEPDR
jgi:hypothetical protein